MRAKNIMKKCYMCGDKLSSQIWRKIANPLEFSLVLSVGQACNLKCINCGNFCPISLPETKRYPVDAIIESLSIIMKNTWRISCLQIQGGEPFVYSDLTKLLNWLKKQKTIGTILIATNGMIIPERSVLDAIMLDKRITVRISDYNLSNIPMQLKGILDEMCIRNGYYEFSDGEGMWYDLGGVHIEPVSDEEKIRHFNTCVFNSCLTLENGELTYCSRATNAYKLQGFDRKQSDYLPVVDNNNFSSDLKEFVNNPKAMEACRYCNGTETERKIMPAVQQ